VKKEKGGGARGGTFEKKVTKGAARIEAKQTIKNGEL